DYRYRLPEDGADIVVLAHPERHFDPRDEIAERIGAQHDHDGEAFSCRLVLLIVNAAVLARHHVERDVILVERLHAIRADVDPVGIKVASHHRAASTDVAPAVHL